MHLYLLTKEKLDNFFELLINLQKNYKCHLHFKLNTTSQTLAHEILITATKIGFYNPSVTSEETEV